MLRCYVRDHQKDWDDCVQVLTHANINGIHSGTQQTLFQRAFSRTQRNPAIFHNEENNLNRVCKFKEYWALKWVATVVRARLNLQKPQLRYQRNFDRRLKRGNAKLKVWDYIML